MTETKSTFAQQWEANKLLKRSKKKAKKELQKKGFGRNESSKMVNKALKNISNKPVKRAAGRGG